MRRHLLLRILLLLLALPMAAADLPVDLPIGPTSGQSERDEDEGQESAREADGAKLKLAAQQLRRPLLPGPLVRHGFVDHLSRAIPRLPASASAARPRLPRLLI